MAPVMPDCPVSYPSRWFLEWLRGWLENGKFAPAEAINFIGSPYVWTEFQYAFAAYMSALGMAYFLRGRGLPRVAAYGAGLLLAFSGYWFTLFSAGHLGWFQWMTYGVFAFGLADRALEKGKPRHWILLGACLAWGSMRQPDMWLLFTAFTGVYFVFRFIVVFLGTARDARVRMLAGFAKGAFLALASLLSIGAASFRSAFTNDLAGRDKQIEEGQTVASDAAANDAEKRWIFATNWSMPPEAVKEFWNAGVEGDTSCPMTLAIGMKNGNGIRPYTGRLGRPLGAPSGNYRQHSLYVGRITCLLALLAIVAAFAARRKGGNAHDRAEMVFFAVAAAVFCIFSMGRFCESVYRTVYALPFGDYLRAPVKWHHLTEFCLCVLAGYGLAALVRMDLKWIGVRGRTVAAAVLVLAGTSSLVSNDRLYCAPHKVDADMQFIDARITQDPRGVAQLKRFRAHIIGKYAGMALLEVPKPQRKDEPHPEMPKPAPLTLALGILSLAGTVAAGAYGALKS